MPAFLLVPFAAERSAAVSPIAILLWWSAAATWVAVNALRRRGLRGWWEFFRFNGARPADWDSGWYLARYLGLQPPVGVINVASVVLLVAVVAGVWWAKRRREPDFPRWQLDLPDPRPFLLVGKVYSPQFSLWLLPGSSWCCRPAPLPRVRGGRPGGLPHAVLVLRGADGRGGCRSGSSRSPSWSGRPCSCGAWWRGSASRAGGCRSKSRPPARSRSGARDRAAAPPRRPPAVPGRVPRRARIGLSLVSVIAVGLLEPLDPVDVPGGPVRRPRPAGTTRSTRPSGRTRSGTSASPTAAGRPTTRAPRSSPCTRSPSGPCRGSCPATTCRGDARVEPRVPRSAARAVRADGRRLRERIARRTIVVTAIFPTAFFFLALHGVAVPVPVGADVPGGAPRPVGARRRVRRARGAHERGSSWSPRSSWRRSPGAPAARALAARAAGAAVIALGPLAWFAWWGVAHGDWLAPIDAQARWGRELQLPWVSLGTRWSSRGRSARTGSRSHDRGARDRGLALAFPALRGSERVYGSLSLLLPLLDPFPDRPLLSMPRFVVVVFPALWGSPASAGAEDPAAARHRRARRRLGPVRDAVRELATSLLTGRRERSEGASGPG